MRSARNPNGSYAFPLLAGWGTPMSTVDANPLRQSQGKT